MTPSDANLRQAIDELANALQTAVLLAGQLATNLRTDANDADRLRDAVSRATAALRTLRPGGGEP